MNPPTSHVPRRSCLSVPATSPRMLQKSMSVPADEVVVDLEDSVAPGQKPQALAAAVAALQSWGGGEVAVRINPPRSRWCHVELVELAGLAGRPRSVVVPKVESAGDLAFVDRLLDGAEAATGRSVPIRIQALVESAAGLARLDEIAGGSPRLEALVLGYADLAASLGRPESGASQLDLWLPAQEATVLAARVHGLQAIDGPFLGTADDDRFRAAAARARDLGFDGKWAIHPSQIGALNALFTPSDEEVAHAHAVLDVLGRAESASKAGAVALDGQMLDEAVRRSALRVLARASAAEGASR